MEPRSRHQDAYRESTQSISRRGVLKYSLGGALATLLGPTLPGAFGAEGELSATNEKSVILLWLEGGPFQQDSFDPKSSTDEKLALKFKPVDTTADGMQLAACIPRLAEQGKHLTLIRSLRGKEKEHSLAQYYMQTGYAATGPIQAPALGSIVSHELGNVPMKRVDADGLPMYISIDHAGYSPGYFGAAHKPYLVWDPSCGPDNLGLPKNVSPKVQARRLALLQSLEEGSGDSAAAKSVIAGRDAARKFMNSRQRTAFDLNRETK